MGDTSAITVLLQRLASGETQAESELLPLVYAGLRAIAAANLRRERAGPFSSEGNFGFITSMAPMKEVRDAFARPARP